MARSVMTADFAEHIFYDHLEYDDSEYVDMVWQDYVEYITDKLERMFPSLYRPYRDNWNIRECLIILQNEHSAVTLSEFSGTVAIYLAPRSDREDTPLGVRWRAQVAPRIDAELSRLRRIGTLRSLD